MKPWIIDLKTLDVSYSCAPNKQVHSIIWHLRVPVTKNVLFKQEKRSLNKKKNIKFITIRYFSQVWKKLDFESANKLGVIILEWVTEFGGKFYGFHMPKWGASTFPNDVYWAASILVETQLKTQFKTGKRQKERAREKTKKRAGETL